MVTSCNAEIAKRFLGVWIPVLREVMSIYSIKKSVKVEYLLSKILTNTGVCDSKPLYTFQSSKFRGVNH